MANQAIALQARAPQGNFLGPAIQQGAQFINMMSQQRAAERQAAAQQQQLDIARTQESRAAALAVPQLNKATSEATAESLKTGELFNQAIYTAAANSNSPEDFLAFAQRIAAAPQFQNDMFLGGLKEVVASLPADPAQFPEWQRQTGIKTVEADKRYKNNPMLQNLGTTTRILNVPEYGGGAAQVVPGSEAAVTIKPTVVNVPGIGAVIVDPNTSQGYPAAAGPVGGYTPPGIVGGPRGGVMPAAPMGAPARGATPVEIALQTNPGAMEDNEYTRSLPGYAGASGRFATFDTPQAGIAAQENMLRRSYVGRGINTVNKIIDKYTPASKENPEAGRNSYKTYVAGKLGIGLDTPITAAQVPVLAAAMRDIETGARPGGTPVRGGGTAPAGAPKTIQQAATAAERARTVEQFKEITGFDFETGDDPVAKLIEGSTSGGAEKLGADIMAFIPKEYGGGSTPGMENIAALEVIGADLMLALAPDGKLGAGISNEDRKVFERLKGKMEDPSVPADTRLAAWKQLKTKMERLKGLESKTPTKGGNAAPKKTPVIPTLTPEQVRANPNIKRWRRSDNGEVMVRQ
jgi:hypothetical protein